MIAAGSHSRAGTVLALDAGPLAHRGIGKQSDLTMYGLTKLYAILNMKAS